MFSPVVESFPALPDGFPAEAATVAPRIATLPNT
jgi:hypothetical protein